MTIRHITTTGARLNGDEEATLRAKYGARLDPVELLDELKRKEASKIDIVTSSGNIEILPVDMEPDYIDSVTGERVAGNQVAMLVNGADDALDGPIPMNNVAFGQLCSKSGIPVRYARELQDNDPELLAMSFNRQMNRRDENVMVRTLDEETRAVLAGTYKRIDDLNVLRPVLPFLAENGWQFQEAAFSDNSMTLRAVQFNWVEEVRVGDPVAMGLRIRNSEVGLGAYSISMELFRPWCTNTCVVTDTQKRYIHRGSESDEGVFTYSADLVQAEEVVFALKVAETLKQIANPDHFRKVIAQLKETTEAEPIDVTSSVKVLASDFGMSQKEENKFLNEVVDGGDASLYGLINGITATARDMGDYERKIHLETQAGSLLSKKSGWKRVINANEDTVKRLKKRREAKGEGQDA